MSMKHDDDLHLSFEEEQLRLQFMPTPFSVLFERGDVSVELYAPRGADLQRPHSRDEIYIVASGTGFFVRGEERVPFAPGDFLFVAAEVPHRFEEFSDDFRTWVIFFGPEGGIEDD
jgi:mannose-6-phosphate isomerase-like protein (cupin superfamily)